MVAESAMLKNIGRDLHSGYDAPLYEPVESLRPLKLLFLTPPVMMLRIDDWFVNTMEVSGLNTCNAKHLGLRVTRILNTKL